MEQPECDNSVGGVEEGAEDVDGGEQRAVAECWPSRLR